MKKKKTAYLQNVTKYKEHHNTNSCDLNGQNDFKLTNTNIGTIACIFIGILNHIKLFYTNNTSIFLHLNGSFGVLGVLIVYVQRRFILFVIYVVVQFYPWFKVIP